MATLLLLALVPLREAVAARQARYAASSSTPTNPSPLRLMATNFDRNASKVPSGPALILAGIFRWSAQQDGRQSTVWGTQHVSTKWAALSFPLHAGLPVHTCQLPVSFERQQHVPPADGPIPAHVQR